MKALITYKDQEIKFEGLTEDNICNIFPVVKAFAKVNGVNIKDKHLKDDRYASAMDGTWNYKGVTIDIDHEE